MKGVYVLLIRLESGFSEIIGALGEKHFDEGFYAYVGSAQMSLEGRVRRHFKKEKRKFWHIDYFLGNPFVRIQSVYYKEALRSEECAIAREIGKRSVAISGFGCSDCTCKSHFFRLDGSDFVLKGMSKLDLEILSF